MLRGGYRACDPKPFKTSFGNKTLGRSSTRKPSDLSIVLGFAPCRGDLTALEATQGQDDSSFSQHPYKCYLEEVASVGNWLKICPRVTSRVVRNRSDCSPHLVGCNIPGVFLKLRAGRARVRVASSELCTFAPETLPEHLTRLSQMTAPTRGTSRLTKLACTKKTSVKRVSPTRREPPAKPAPVNRVPPSLSLSLSLSGLIRTSAGDRAA